MGTLKLWNWIAWKRVHVAIWLRDNPLSQYIRREVFLDVSFIAASFFTLDSISGGSQTFDLAVLTGGSRPNGEVRN